MSPVEKIEWLGPVSDTLALELLSIGVAMTSATYSPQSFDAWPPSPRAGSGAPDGCGKPRDVVGLHEPRTGGDA